MGFTNKKGSHPPFFSSSRHNSRKVVSHLFSWFGSPLGFCFWRLALHSVVRHARLSVETADDYSGQVKIHENSYWLFVTLDWSGERCVAYWLTLSCLTLLKSPFTWGWGKWTPVPECTVVSSPFACKSPTRVRLQITSLGLKVRNKNWWSNVRVIVWTRTNDIFVGLTQ